MALGGPKFRRVFCTFTLLFLQFTSPHVLFAENKDKPFIEVTAKKTVSDDALLHGDFLNPYGLLVGATATGTLGYGGYQVARRAGGLCFNVAMSAAGWEKIEPHPRRISTHAPPEDHSGLKHKLAVAVLLGLSGLSYGVSGVTSETMSKAIDFSNGQAFPLSSTNGGDTTTLKLKYQVVCAPSSTKFQGVNGYVHFAGKILRADLHAGTTELEVLLGQNDPKVAPPVLKFDESKDCKIVTLDVAPAYYPDPAKLSAEQKAGAWTNPEILKALALRYGPTLVGRPDQLKDPHSDLPLHLSPSIHPGSTPETMKLVYTASWSDENSLTSTKDSEFQYGRYGRTLDIEKIFEVEIDRKTLKAKSGMYHGGLKLLPFQSGIGHGFWDYQDGKDVGPNPVLYVVSAHNTLSDKSDALSYPIGHSLAPGAFLEKPVAREVPLFEHPWMLDVSAQELRREGKPARPPEAYLYVKLRTTSDGAKQLGAFHNVTGNLEIGTYLYTAGGSLDRFGEDLFQRESIIAIPLGDTPEEVARHQGEILAEHSGALVSFEKKGDPQFTLERNAASLFLLSRDAQGQLQVKDVSSQFYMRSPGGFGALTTFQAK